MFEKLVIRIILISFFFTSVGPLPDVSAQTLIDLPAPGMMVNKSIPFDPLQLKGILVNVKNPLRFDFLVDKGDSGLSGEFLKGNITRLAKYFLTCLAVPEDDLWVNLSPYERDRIVPGNFGTTLMGKDLLEQDYLLKQIMASLSYPENDLGKQFWQKVYRKSYELYGTTEIPINTFNKVWITPKFAHVYVQGNAAFVVNSQLDVMLEADYKAWVHHLKNNNTGLSQNAGAYSQVFREVILPELRQEINQGKNFAVVRQVYNAMILATWYKRHLKDSVLGRMYVGKNQVKGVDVADKDAKEKIFRQYLKAYKKCVYNYIKEDYDPFTQQTVPRKYASGGLYFVGFGGPASKEYAEVASPRGMSIGADLAMASVDIDPKDDNGRKIINFEDSRSFEKRHPFKEVPNEAHARVSSKRNEDNAQLSEPLPVQELNRPTVRPTRWMDTLAWTSGMILAERAFGPDAVSLLLASTVTLPHLTRYSLGLHVLTHDVLGHAVPLAVKTKSMEPLRPSSLRKSLNLNRWDELLNPLKIPQFEDPYVPVPSGEEWDQRVAKFGFGTTVGLSLLSTAGVFFSGLHHAWMMPLLGPVGVSGLAAIKASWSSDIKRGGLKKDRYECGNYGIFWIGTPEEGPNPEWLEEDEGSMIWNLITRGGQSAGRGLILDNRFSATGQPQQHIVKVVKYHKRGKKSDLPRVLLTAYHKQAPSEFKTIKISGMSTENQNEPVIFGVGGHVRYATGGRVSEENTQPFVSLKEHRTQMVLQQVPDGNGQILTRFVPDKKDFFVIISHNGDNDGYFLLDRYLTLDEMREFFPRVLHMEKKVWIPPDEEAGMPGYFDYVNEGDTPGITPVLHFLIDQGSFPASVRYGYMMSFGSADDAIKNVLTGEQLSILGGIFERVFDKDADSMTRPMLNGPKDYKDLLVTEEMQRRDTGLRAQFEAIQRFKEHVITAINETRADLSPAGNALRHLQSDQEMLREFVDTVVERFFTADRWNAAKEFRLRAKGSFGVVFRDSLKSGVTIFSKSQGMTIGWNLKNKLFAYASDILPMLGKFKNERLENLFILDPRGSGEIADVGFSSGDFYLRVYSTNLQRDLSSDEILKRTYPLNKNNPYYSPPAVYPDPSRIIDEDLENGTHDLGHKLDDWRNPQSEDRQTLEDLVGSYSSLYVQKFIEDNMTYKIGPVVIERLRQQLHECESGQTSCFPDQMAFLRHQTSISAKDSALADYVENIAHEFVAVRAERITADLISGTISDRRLNEISHDVNGEVWVRVDRLIQRMINEIMTDVGSAKKKWDKKKKVRPATVDTFISGYEKSFWLGKILGKLLKIAMPDLQVEVVSANQYLRKPTNFGVNKRTIAFVNSLSGSTFPSVPVADILFKITHGKTYITTSRKDSMILKAVEQEVNDRSPFSRKAFFIDKYYPAESAPTAALLLYAEEIMIVIKLIKRLKEIFPNHRPWGLQASDEDITTLESMAQEMIDDARRITGFDEDQHAVETPENKALVNRGEYKAKHLLETPWVNYLFRAFVGGIFWWTAPVQKIAGLLGVHPGIAVSLGIHRLSLYGTVDSIAKAADLLLALGMPFLLTTLVYRTWSKRPRWARLGPPPEVIGDLDGIHQIVDQYVSKLGAQAPPSEDISVRSGDPTDLFGAENAHRVRRGTEVTIGIPMDQSLREDVETTLKQAKSIRNGVWGKWGQGGAEITTLGTGDYRNPKATHFHINIGGRMLSPDDSQFVHDFNTWSFDPFRRLFAYKVMYNAMFAKASTFSVGFSLRLNLGIFNLAIEPHKYQIWDRAWTFPRISVHTTRSPVGINKEALEEAYNISHHHLDHPDDAFNPVTQAPPARYTTILVVKDEDHRNGKEAGHEFSDRVRSTIDDAMAVPDIKPLTLPLVLGIEGFSMTDAAVSRPHSIQAVSNKKEGISDAAMLLQKAGKVRSMLMSFLIMAAIGGVAPSVKAAILTPDPDGKTIHVLVQEKDTVSKIMREDHLPTPFWGPDGSEKKIAQIIKERIPDANYIYPGETFDIPTGQEFRLEQSQKGHDRLPSSSATSKRTQGNTRQTTAVRQRPLPAVSPRAQSRTSNASVSVGVGHGAVAKGSFANFVPKRHAFRPLSSQQATELMGFYKMLSTTPSNVSAGSAPPPKDTDSEILRLVKSRWPYWGFAFLGIGVGSLLWTSRLKLRKKKQQRVISKFEEPSPISLRILDSGPRGSTPEERSDSYRRFGASPIEPIADPMAVHNTNEAMLAQEGTHGLPHRGGIDMNSQLMQLNFTGDDQNKIGSHDYAMLSGDIIKVVDPQVSGIVTVTPDMLKNMLGESYFN